MRPNGSVRIERSVTILSPGFQAKGIVYFNRSHFYVAQQIPGSAVMRLCRIVWSSAFSPRHTLFLPWQDRM
jgi:hypothetical protein